ncbi:MAG TPA: alpha-L-fucosidase, partial [Paludibacter sp.]|nr:alpha-L-fucosidase [Paludibacter sp.]
KNWGSSTLISGANAYCGSSIQVTGACGGSIDYTLTDKLLPNTSYRLKCLLYSDKEAYITLNGCGINGSTADFQVIKNTGSTWQVVEFNFRTGILAASQNFWLNSCSGSNQATDIRLDNLEIYQSFDPVLSASKSSIWLDGSAGNSFTVSGSYLSNPITLTAPSGVTLSTYSIPANPSALTVTVTYDGTSVVNDTIRLTSGTSTTKIAVVSATEKMATGSFQPTWESLSQFNEAPEWYQNAKFGIWAHWGPQCQPEQGDWYARFMYFSGTTQFNWHASNYGNQSTFGFKDVINTWKAQSWNPDSLVHLYKNAGAEYFFAMANHHDNLDMWDSKYQPWNTSVVGPKKDIISGWSVAARKYGLPFGVSVHASHAWTWLEPSQDYDGKLTTADGVGKWWEGLNPQDLYAQNHARSSGSTNSGTIHSQWDWENGASIPDAAYINKFYNRTLDLINRYNPDLLYFDDTALPFWKVNNVGLDIAAHMYNKSAAVHNGKNQTVIFGKILTEQQKNCLVWDVERGVPDRPQQKYWQTCTCIGDWHYNRNVYNNNQYKSAQTVIRMLIDIVSKNGNLLLNIPVRGDGTIDEKELAVVQGITTWMKVNKESIQGTRPWFTFGEGPTADAVNPISAQGFNEGITYSTSDIRFVKKGDSLLYVTAMGWPTTGKIVLKRLATSQPYLTKNIKNVQLLGGGNLTFTRNADGLTINLPATKPATADVATVFKISLDTVVSLESLKGLIRVAEVNDSIAQLNAGSNSGQYSVVAVTTLENSITTAKSYTQANTNNEITVAVTNLQNAIIAFKSSARMAGGIIDYPKTQNITNKYLKEARLFSRVGTTTVRFGQPANWNSDFNIPQTDGSGTKQGIDKYPGFSNLMLGAWSDVSRSTVDAANARLYKKITLPAGRYFFGASYNTLYNMSKAYIFASKTIPTIANVESTAIAFHSIGADAADNSMYGIEFTLVAETEVYLGWVADLTTTANLEFRVKEVELLQVLAPTDTYVPSGAVSAPAGTDILLSFTDFARVYSTSGTYSMKSDNTGYLVGASGGSLDLGVIDFGTNKYKKVFVNTANASSSLNGATYSLYIDDQTTPIASIPAVGTGSATTFVKSEATIGSISGLHKVSLKFDNHTSSLLSAGFADAGINAVKEIKLSDLYKIYTTKNSITVDGLTNNNIALYSSNGILICSKTSITGKVEFKVNHQGVYLLEIDEKAIKVIV